jgi:uncharacterized protein (TIRG00374 family)
VLLEVHPKPAWMDRLSGTLAAGAVAGLAVVFILPRTGDLYRKLIGKLPLAENLREKLTNFAGQILAGLAAFHDTRRFLAFAAFTATVWGIDTCTAMAVGRGLGIQLSFGMASLLICGLGLGSALPSTPGYVGIFQFVAVSVLTPFGIPKDGALAEVLILQAISYGVVLAFGLPGLYKFKGWRRATAAGE